jgi:hypothetical protein
MLLLLLLLIAVIGTVIVHKLEDNWGYEFLCNIILAVTVVVWLIFIVLLIGLPLNRMSIKNEIVKYKALNNSYEYVKKHPEIPGTAIIQEQVFRANQEMESNKYFNNTWYWDLYVPDEVDSLKPIR